jgi:hypothetical protein
MHGGAPGSGAPKGNRNAFKTGVHTRSAVEMRRRVRELHQATRDILEQLRELEAEPAPDPGQSASRATT